jgi:exonuclease SbcC
MTITRLEIEALGPFAGTVSLEFPDLARGGLFLIHGPTGSGKTSILDAICFALYGASSGDERKAADLRSHHAPEDRQSQVRLDFLLDGQAYRVRRWMSARRVQNFTEKASLERIEPDGAGLLLADKRQEVNQRVQDLLRLDAGQFRQVIVLPQGRFRDFLTAGSGVREGILRSLFDTGRLGLFAELVGRRRQVAQDGLFRLTERQSLLLAELGLDAADGLAERLATLEAEAAVARERQEKAREGLEGARRRHESARAAGELSKELAAAADVCARLGSESASWDEMAGRLDRARRAAAIRHVHGEWQDRRQTLAQTGRSVAELDRALAGSSDLLQACLDDDAQARCELELLPARQEQLARRQALRGAMAGLSAAESEAAAGRAALDGMERDIGQAETQLAEAEARLERLRGERAGLQNRVAGAGGLAALAALAARLGEAERRAAQSVALRDQESRNLERLEHDATALSALAAAARTRLEESRQAGLRQAAGSLAATLLPGQACPVCGATEHPHPASPEVGVRAASEELESEADALSGRQAKLELELGLHRERFGRAAADLVAHETEATRIADDIDRQRTELGRDDGGRSLPEDLADWLAADWRIAGNAETVRRLSRLTARAEEAARALPQLDRQAAALEANRETQLGALLAGQARRTAAVEAAAATDRRLATEKARLGEAFGLAEGALPEPEELDRLIAGDQAWIERTAARAEAARSRLETRQREHRVLESRLADQAGRQENEARTAAEAETRWTEALAGKGFSGEAEALAALMPEGLAAERQAALEDWRRRSDIALARLEDLRRRIEGQAADDGGDTARELAEAGAAEQEAGRELAVRLHRQEQAGGIARQLSELVEELSTREGTLSSLTALHRLVSGQEASGNYVNLQRYALSVYLDEILVSANLHLRDMSRGRYELVRADNTQGKKRTGGLELYVQDTVTGLQRATESLSGGESFLSALSLALGLSAVVHERSGGVRLDTLFVDEGFGSLDEDALQDAMQVLGRIHEKGRTIGIISHVRELRERIPVRLLVSKGPEGSAAAWER